MNIRGNSYAENDLIALATDLEVIYKLGFQIARLSDLVKHLIQNDAAWFRRRVVVLTCDDGADFDFFDLPHPTAGIQRSVINTLLDFKERRGGSSPHITNFVIVSPAARAELDRTCMIGKGWWTDVWWERAVRSGVMDISNHSWDHNHDALPEAFSMGVTRGTFSSIDTKRLADLEIGRAAEFLRVRIPNPGNALFAYPYGDANEFLMKEYFPKFGAELGIEAAIGDEPNYVGERSNRWRVPRFIAGRDWRAPAQLEGILWGANQSAL